MAEETQVTAAETKVEAKTEAKTETKATAKPKTTARKAPAKRKTTAKKSTVRSNVRSVENKAAAYERKVRKTARKAEKKIDAAEKSASKFADRAGEVAHNALLASLGFYGKAYDQAQERLDAIQDRMEERRKKAFIMYADLVKRGEKVESKAKNAIDDIDLSSLTDRKALEAKLEKARARFAEMKDSMSKKAA